MLLDRKRINKWAKWVALGLAVIFGVSFVVIGVGQGGGGNYNVLEALGCSSQTPASNPQTPEEKIAAYEATLAQNPNDTTALLGLATVYQQNDDLTTAAVYLEKIIAIDPSQKDIYLRLANLYLNAKVAGYEAAVRVLNKLTSLDPNNADVYLKLGTAQNSLGHTEAAVLAWQKYLELAPNGEMASVVKEQIAKLSQKPTTTTTASATTTSAGATSTTAGASTSTTASTATSGSTTTSTGQ